MLKNLKLIQVALENFLHKRASQEATVGLDFNHSKAFAVELQRKASSYLLTRFACQDVESDSRQTDPSIQSKVCSPWVENQSLCEKLSALLRAQKFSSTTVNIALSGPMVLTRFITFPKMALSELKAAMRYEVEKYIPFEGTDVIADFHILGDDSQDKKNMRVLLVAAKKTEVFSLVESFRKTNLKIRVIDIHAFACFNSFCFSNPDLLTGTTVLLDIGCDTTSLLILVDRQPAFIREISLGSRDFIEALKKKISGATPQKEKLGLREMIQCDKDSFQQAIEPIESQIRLSLNYFVNNNPKAQTPHGAYVSGELSVLEEFQQRLQTSLGLELRPWDCLRGIELDPKVSQKDLQSFRHMLPVSLGLALRMGQTV